MDAIPIRDSEGEYERMGRLNPLEDRYTSLRSLETAEKNWFRLENST